MVGQKEEALSRLDDERLLDLARSISKNQIDNRTSRNSIIKIIKSYLSMEEIKQKVSETRNNRITTSLAKENMMRRPGFLAGSVASIVSGIIILALLAMPVYDFEYMGSGLHTWMVGIGDSYASGYDFGLGSVWLQGDWRQLATPSFIIWMIVATSIAVIMVGLLSLPRSDTSARSQLWGLIGDRSGTLIAVLGFIMILLNFTAVQVIRSTTLLVVHPFEYWGDVVFSTFFAMMIMGLIVFFSGLEIRHRSLQR